MDGGMFPGPLDPHLDIAAFQFELGNILLDEELDEFFSALFDSFVTVGPLATPARAR